MKAKGDCVIVELVDGQEVSPGGLVMPDVVLKNKNVREGKVISAGPGRWDAGQWSGPAAVEGHRILYPSAAGWPFTREGRKLVALRGQEVLADLDE